MSADYVGEVRAITAGEREAAIALAGEMVEQHIHAGNSVRALAALERMRGLLLGRRGCPVDDGAGYFAAQGERDRAAMEGHS